MHVVRGSQMYGRMSQKMVLNTSAEFRALHLLVFETVFFLLFLVQNRYRKTSGSLSCVVLLLAFSVPSAGGFGGCDLGYCNVQIVLYLLKNLEF